MNYFDYDPEGRGEEQLEFRCELFDEQGSICGHFFHSLGALVTHQELSEGARTSVGA